MDSNIYNSWLEVSLDDLSHNIEQVRSIIEPKCEIMAVVKSNGYGHGAVEISKHLEKECHISYLSVASIFEALELRQAGISTPILVMGALLNDQLEEAIKNDITITLCSIETAKRIVEIAQGLNKVPKAHIKIDSGMRRIGLRPGEELLIFIRELKELGGIDIEGVFTHFAESGSIDKTFTFEQLRVFKEGLGQLKENGIEPKYIHSAATQAMLEVPDSHFNLVRSGKTTYGYHGLDHEYNKIDLKPILTWKAVITSINKLNKGESLGYSRTFKADKDMLIAVVAVGFGDGYSSLLSNKGTVIVKGKKAPIVGRVCMDSCFVDVTDIENVKIGDTVTLLGEEGSEKIEKKDICAITGFQVSEVIANIGRRVGRIYVKGKN